MMHAIRGSNILSQEKFEQITCMHDSYFPNKKRGLVVVNSNTSPAASVHTYIGGVWLKLERMKRKGKH